MRLLPPQSGDAVVFLSDINIRITSVDWFDIFSNSQVSAYTNLIMEAILRADQNVFFQHRPVLLDRDGQPTVFWNVRLVPLRVCFESGSLAATLKIGLAAAVGFVTFANNAAGFLESYPSARENFPLFKQDAARFSNQLKEEVAKGLLQMQLGDEADRQDRRHEQDLEVFRGDVIVRDKGDVSYQTAHKRMLQEAIGRGKIRNAYIDENGDVVEAEK